MQCILTRNDFDLYYGGESISLDQAQSFTCPYCGKMGFTEALLQDHVKAEHTESPLEVVCPICAASPGGDPNHVTDDFIAHLTLEHRMPRDSEETGNARHLRRMFHPGRGLGSRSRRNMHFGQGSGLSSGGPMSSSPNSRDAMDPIAELLSQLSGARRAAGSGSGNTATASQLHQLQLMQLQLERQQQQAQQAQNSQGSTRNLVERLAVPAPRRQGNLTGNMNPGQGSSLSYSAVVESSLSASSSSHRESQFLLARIHEPSFSETELQSAEVENANRSFFVQDLILSTLNESDTESEAPSIEDAAVMGEETEERPVEMADTVLRLESLNLRDREEFA
ncbi:putative E3 ubiquitin-protein ligase KCMF1 [Apostichopus japonicus]|uniref:RING-type E3 ubiquitin transferase n=2 Tax=Stichopus japonicus TaxID=307972 RepID=A0A2G8L158_STIJA|nr:putative E3 ubiquitin-protein ligase KCMF1 [Apostichopus japonicus]